MLYILLACLIYVNNTYAMEAMKLGLNNKSTSNNNIYTFSKSTDSNDIDTCSESSDSSEDAYQDHKNKLYTKKCFTEEENRSIKNLIDNFNLAYDMSIEPITIDSFLTYLTNLTKANFLETIYDDTSNSNQKLACKFTRKNIKEVLKNQLFLNKILYLQKYTPKLLQALEITKNSPVGFYNSATLDLEKMYASYCLHLIPNTKIRTNQTTIRTYEFIEAYPIDTLIKALKKLHKDFLHVFAYEDSPEQTKELLKQTIIPALSKYTEYKDKANQNALPVNTILLALKRFIEGQEDSARDLHAYWYYFWKNQQQPNNSTNKASDESAHKFAQIVDEHLKEKNNNKLSTSLIECFFWTPGKQKKD